MKKELVLFEREGLSLSFCLSWLSACFGRAATVMRPSEPQPYTRRFALKSDKLFLKTSFSPLIADDGRVVLQNATTIHGSGGRGYSIPKRGNGIGAERAGRLGPARRDEKEKGGWSSTPSSSAQARDVCAGKERRDQRADDSSLFAPSHSSRRSMKWSAPPPLFTNP